MYISTPNNSNIVKIEKFLWLIVIFSLILISNNAFAVDPPAAAPDDPLGARLCAILGILMGPTAKAIATIAMIFVAIGLFAGRMTWLTVIPIIIGIIVIFSAPALVKFIAGDNVANEQCDVAAP